AFRGLGKTKSVDLRDWAAVVKFDEKVRGFEVAVDNSLLVRVLDSLADLDEQLQPLGRVEVVLIAVFRDPDAANQFHYKIGPAILRRAGVQHLRDVWVIHNREGLSLGFEARDHLTSVHARLDDLERDAAVDRLFLLGYIDDPTPAFPDPFTQFVTANARARLFLRGQFKTDGPGSRIAGLF